MIHFALWDESPEERASLAQRPLAGTQRPPGPCEAWGLRSRDGICQIKPPTSSWAPPLERTPGGTYVTVQAPRTLGSPPAYMVAQTPRFLVRLAPQFWKSILLVRHTGLLSLASPRSPLAIWEGETPEEFPVDGTPWAQLSRRILACHALACFSERGSPFPLGRKGTHLGGGAQHGEGSFPTGGQDKTPSHSVSSTSCPLAPAPLYPFIDSFFSAFLPCWPYLKWYLLREALPGHSGQSQAPLPCSA